MSGGELILILGITAIAAAVQGSVGFGFNILAVPVLTLIDPDLTPIPMILASFPLNVMTFIPERRSAELGSAAWVLAGRVPGTVLGAWLLATADGRVIDALIACVVLAATAVLWRGARITRTTPTRIGAGFVAGVTGTVSAIGGPALALLYHGERGPIIRSTLATIFVGGAIIATTTLGISGQIGRRDLQLALVLIPGMILGFRASRLLVPRIDGARLRTATLVVAAFAGVTLGVKTVLGG